MDPTQSAHVKLLAADLLSLTARSAGAGVSRAGRTITRAEAVGVVVSRDRANKFLRFHVDDGSGCVPCILWLNHRQRPGSGGGPSYMDLTAEVAAEHAAAVRLGALVRVRGRVGVFRGSVQITVGDVVAERDANVEVLHWLQCVRLARLCYDVPAPARPRS
ncbi:OB-fold nucleic acid binding domain containing protein isoform X1 [Iris pallida]|uniref:CST complex subunit STN1 n=1 Tax=Iris pallida TaxID=29817 RepID=A0AAX6FT69_IRIPA|nr:OB-fold nucleic acid binding domain containing protein isoform X1 [Iris pallida]KAJ6819248.1 OB-fold nucleic acid binding domain containing protein isoform X1 [Iris pallida]